MLINFTMRRGRFLGRVEFEPADWAGVMVRKPEVNAVEMELMAAAGEQAIELPFSKLGEADGALRDARVGRHHHPPSCREHKNRKRGEDGRVEARAGLITRWQRGAHPYAGNAGCIAAAVPGCDLEEVEGVADNVDGEEAEEEEGDEYEAEEEGDGVARVGVRRGIVGIGGGVAVGG